MKKVRSRKSSRASVQLSEIEESLTRLVAAPFDKESFPYEFLRAFGERDDSLKRLKRDNEGNPPGEVIKKGGIHIVVCPLGETEQTLRALRPDDAGLAAEKAQKARKTNRNKVQFLLTTDGQNFAAAGLEQATRDSGELKDLPACVSYTGPSKKTEEKTGRSVFFGPLAGIHLEVTAPPRTLNDYAAKQLHQLYAQLKKVNPDYDLNHFMAQLIFCFFAQDTGIFYGEKIFTTALRVETNESPEKIRPYMEQLFRVFDLKEEHRTAENAPKWTRHFPYVNGNLFSGDAACPVFDKTAYEYLTWAEGTSWKEIDPDIFGTMIQVVAGPEAREKLGAHYTSTENILRVIRPLFLDALGEMLEDAGQNKQKLLALKERLAKIRVFDPACGSGNFLVIAYKQLRSLQNEIDERLGIEQAERRSAIPLGNFYGIEIDPFCTEIARLALIVAEFQCNEFYITQKEAISELLPLEDTHRAIKCGNALRLDWLEVCPPEEGVETYVCGNPPYRGSTYQTPEQKQDIAEVFRGRLKSSKSLDYIAGWFMKAVEYGQTVPSTAAFVSTNSICQGEQVPLLWPLVFQNGYEISFAYGSFKWGNNASHNAGVTVTIVGLAPLSSQPKRLFLVNRSNQVVSHNVETINAYLVPGKNIIIKKQSKPVSQGLAEMVWGNKPVDGGNLFLTADERDYLLFVEPNVSSYVKRFLGSQELIRGEQRYCIWINDEDRKKAEEIPEIARRVSAVAEVRANSKAKETRPAAAYPHRFRQIQTVATQTSIIVPSVSSERRPYLPVDLLDKNCIIGNSCSAIYDAPLWNLALIASRLHLVWVAAVSGKLKTDFRYSNTLGWNTFPVPKLTENDKRELSQSAEHILLTREEHFPKTIAELYDPDRMPEDLKEAHAYNDELVERIFSGKVFTTDTERLETLFDLYSKMVARQDAAKAKAKTSRKGKASS